MGHFFEQGLEEGEIDVCLVGRAHFLEEFIECFDIEFIVAYQFEIIAELKEFIDGHAFDC